MRLIRRSLLYFAAFLGVYFLVLFCLSRITVNKNDADPAKDVLIFIKTNGVHTDVVVPVSNAIYDWNILAPSSNSLSPNTKFEYVAFGWGDRDFYLNTPRWSDLKVSTALNAAFFQGSGVMHVTFHKKIKQDERCIPIYLSSSEYQKLMEFIKSSFEYDSSNHSILIPDAHYGARDNFYNAKGKYNLFYTCNSWANNALKFSGQKAALWTLTDTGIFVHYR